MMTFSSQVKVFIASQPTDMRRSFDGLAREVKEGLHLEPFSSHLFVFYGRRHDRIKILYWDRNGFCIWSKRLEKGAFHFPTLRDKACCCVSGEELHLLLQGIELTTPRLGTVHCQEVA